MSIVDFLARKGALEFSLGVAILLFLLLLAPPSVHHPFGADHLGRDVLSRTIHAIRIDLWMGLAGVVMPLVLGTFAGLAAGHFGNWTDVVLSRLIDVTIAFPFFVLVIAIVSLMGPVLTNYFVALALVSWVSYARLVRAQTAILRDKDYVLAAKVLGYSTPVILARHLMPSILPMVLVYATTDVVMIVLAGASLGFLGLGVQPPTPEWGAMIAEGQPYVVDAWWICLFSGLAAILLGFGFVRQRRAWKDDAAMSDAPPSPLSVQGLTVSFGALSVVHNVSFDLRPGEVLAIVGESGSGKSTIAKALTRLVVPSGGHILFRGDDINRLKGAGLSAYRRRVQMVFQNPFDSLNPAMTVLDAIAEPLRRHGISGAAEARRRALGMMRQVELPEEFAHRRPRQLSGGQCQRVGIARALILYPEVLVADEITSALDVTIQAQIIRLLARLRRERNLTVIYISHDLDVVRKLCDRIAVFRTARLVETGETSTVLDRPQSEYTALLRDSVPRMDVETGYV